MVPENVIVYVTESTDWVNHIVIATMICGFAWTILNIWTNMGRKIFNIIGCILFVFTNAFNMREFFIINDFQKFLSTTILTVTIRAKRSAWIERFAHALLDGLPGVITYFDDMLIFWLTSEEHHYSLKQTSSKARKWHD